MKEQSKQTSVRSMPLLYIHQPGAKSVELKMQQSYYASEKKQQVVVEEKGETLEKEELEFVMEEVEQEKISEIITVDQEEEQEEEEMEQVEVRKKPFKEMEIDEKIEYLLNRPSYIPNPLCEFVVSGDHLMGYVVRQQGDFLFIRTQASIEMLVVPVKDISSIRMLIW